MVWINSGSWFAQSSMSSAISFQSSFCCSVSNFGTNLADTLRRFKSSVSMVWTEPALIPTSPTISCIVTRRSSSTFLRTWSITSLFRLVDGLPERWSLSTDARPSLKRLNHCFIWVGLKGGESSSQFQWFTIDKIELYFLIFFVLILGLRLQRYSTNTKRCPPEKKFWKLWVLIFPPKPQ